MKYSISPSLLAADFTKLGSEVEKVDRAGAAMLHLDVMDGIFVPNISFGLPVIESLRRVTGMSFDVHLMISDPLRYIERFAAAGADIITFHYESQSDAAATVAEIKRCGKRASVAISPDTPADVLYPLLPQLDMVLVMTVHPGFGGQKLIPETLGKVRQLRERADELGLPLDIEVDGGITPENIGNVTAAGANVIVAGSSIFRAPDAAAAISALLAACN